MIAFYNTNNHKICFNAFQATRISFKKIKIYPWEEALRSIAKRDKAVNLPCTRIEEKWQSSCPHAPEATHVKTEAVRNDGRRCGFEERR